VSGPHYCLDAEGEPLHLYSQVIRAADALQLPPGVPPTQLERGVIVQVIERDRMRVRWPGTEYSEVMRSGQVLKAQPPTQKRDEPGGLWTSGSCWPPDADTQR
jgi:hypothetical protein